MAAPGDPTEAGTIVSARCAQDDNRKWELEVDNFLDKTISKALIEYHSISSILNKSVSIKIQ